MFLGTVGPVIPFWPAGTRSFCLTIFALLPRPFKWNKLQITNSKLVQAVPSPFTNEFSKWWNTYPDRRQAYHLRPIQRLDTIAHANWPLFHMSRSIRPKMPSRTMNGYNQVDRHTCALHSRATLDNCQGQTCSVDIVAPVSERGMNHYASFTPFQIVRTGVKHVTTRKTVN